MATFTRPWSEFEPVIDPNYDASERAYVRAAARRRWMRANGVETGPIKPRSAYPRLVSAKAKVTNRELQRRYRIRVKAARLGITVAEAAAITPQMPNRGKHATRRDGAGRFTSRIDRPGS
jgi:hypothetical protein